MGFDTIYTRKGEAIHVSPEDWRRLAAFNWCLNGDGYAVRGARRAAGRWTLEYLHRLLMGLRPGDKRVVDHANGDKLDNRRVNLRICSNAENLCNAKHFSNNTSGFKGVGWCKPRGKWRARIQINGYYKHLGYFETAEGAYAARCAAANQLHGEFARHE